MRKFAAAPGGRMPPGNKERPAPSRMGKPASSRRHGIVKMAALWALLAIITCAGTGCLSKNFSIYEDGPQAPGVSVATSQPTAAVAPAKTDAQPQSIIQASPPPSDDNSAQSYASVSRLDASEPPPAAAEIFYSGAFSMMGFADTPSISMYESAMPLLSTVASLCWDDIQVSRYRYDRRYAKEDMALDPYRFGDMIGEPSFYLTQALTTQPNHVKEEGEPVITAGTRLNEPKQSYFEWLGVAEPTPLDAVTGLSVAVEAADTDALTIIVTDLHDLRVDDGWLLDALKARSMKPGQSLGIVAVMSEFSGYIPDVGASKTAFTWGDAPTGTLKTLLEYNNFSIGLSIDPLMRRVRMRPFYVLCMGRQAVVDRYVGELSARLQHDFASTPGSMVRTAVYASDYANAAYSLAANTTYAEHKGVYADPRADMPGGIRTIEVNMSKPELSVQWQVVYQASPTDPRYGAISARDIQFTAVATNSADGSVYVLPNITCQDISQDDGASVMRLKLAFKQGELPKGEYSLQISAELSVPTMRLAGSDWMNAFGQDIDYNQILDAEKGLAAFDGGRTIYLSRLIQSLGKANMERMTTVSLGSFTIQIRVIA